MDGEPQQQTNPDGIKNDRGDDPASRAADPSSLKWGKFLLSVLRSPFLTLLEEALWRSRDELGRKRHDCLSEFRLKYKKMFWAFFVFDAIVLFTLLLLLLGLFYSLSSNAVSIVGSYLAK